MIDLHVTANAHLGLCYYNFGSYHQALAFFQRTMTILASEPIDAYFGLSGMPSVSTRQWSTWCHAELGTFSEGMAIGEAGVRIAESVQSPRALASAYTGVGRLALRKGDVDQAMVAFERGLALCKAMHIPFQLLHVAAFLGTAYALTGRVAESLPTGRTGGGAGGLGTLYGRSCHSDHGAK